VRWDNKKSVDDVPTFSNKCAKNCCKRTILVQVIAKDMVTCFLEHSVVVAYQTLWQHS